MQRYTQSENGNDNQGFVINLQIVLANLLFALPFILPIHTPPITSFYNEYFAAFAGLLLAFSLMLKDRLGGARLHLAWWSMPLISLICVVGVQVVTGYYAYIASALMTLIYLGLAFLLVNLGRNQAANHGLVYALCNVLPGLMLAGGINLVIAVMQKIAIPEVFQNLVIPLVDTNQGAYGNLAQQNHFADLQALSCLSCLFLGKIKGWHKFWHYSLASLFGAGIVLSGARSGWLYLVIVLWYLGVFSNLQGLRAALGRPWVWMLLLGIVIPLALSLPHSHWQRYLQFEETLGARGFMWRHTLGIIIDYPWLGVGFEGFAYQIIKQQQHSGEFAKWGIDQYAHNFILQLAGNAGIPITLLFGMSFFQTWRWLHLQLAKPGQRVVASILTILILHSLIEQPLYYLYFLLPLAYLLGSVDRSCWVFKAPRMCWFATCWFISFAFVSVAMIKVIIDYKRIESMHLDSDWLKNYAIAHYQEQGMLLYQWRSNHTFPGVLEALYPEIYVARDATLESKLELNRRLLRYAPVADVVYRQAALLAQSQQRSDAEVWLSSAALAYPRSIKEYLPGFQQRCEFRGGLNCQLTQQLLSYQVRAEHILNSPKAP